MNVLDKPGLNTLLPINILPAYINSKILKSTLSLGGAEEDRTPDPLRARQVLSQLSYDPNISLPKTNCVGTLQSSLSYF